MEREGAFKNQIRSGKRVRVADDLEADIFGRPRPETFGLEQRFSKRGWILSVGKRNNSAQHAPAEIPNSLTACERCLERA
jgi:hypothetical protein